MAYGHYELHRMEQARAYTPQQYFRPPVCHLPLPPSPVSPRSNSRLSNHNSNLSNDSNGIPSWNTELSGEPAEFFYVVSDGETNDLERSPKFGGGPLMKARSLSPSRSNSPHKRKKKNVTNTLDFLNSQCHLEGCSASIVVNSTKFLICRHQLCHASEYFKQLLSCHRGDDDITIAVSGLTQPSPSTQFRWFVESCIPCPALRDISDDILETCMRLSKRFQAQGLEIRCGKFIIENVHQRQPIVALCWLNWSLKHKFEAQVIAACMPCVARLSLCSLEEHRNMLTEKIYSDILAAKLRGSYEKAVKVFRTIHTMDHFSVDLMSCPKCGRTKDGLRVKVNADPCRWLSKLKLTSLI
ncbi:hypothetical protein WR25_24441 isoform F [Diploscapter pachys]|uniref:BTB domain-containing protein n=1 Tax=Diploscapter pachys TaxID=2018661 RepID=A0A2A2LIV7_9BILA|nr:hypothetical protein WR25_24441 isoform B [Diploscapter pachys]PAV86132.1 hypothetical protein WR25_24441 isoform F [Diploscapter pachys]